MAAIDAMNMIVPVRESSPSSTPAETGAGSLVDGTSTVSPTTASVVAGSVVAGSVVGGDVSGSVGSMIGVVGADDGTVATGPVRLIAGAGSSSSSPGSFGIWIQRISPTSQRCTNGK